LIEASSNVEHRKYMVPEAQPNHGVSGLPLEVKPDTSHDFLDLKLFMAWTEEPPAIWSQFIDFK
jgi:hypothetical protein